MSIFTVLSKLFKKNTVEVDSVATTLKATTKTVVNATKTPLAKVERKVVKTPADRPAKKTVAKKQFDIYKFLTKFSVRDMPRYFEIVVHYEDGKQIVTDGKFMVVNDCEYSSERENKDFSISDITKEECEQNGSYPNWKRAIPDLTDYEKCFINIDTFATIRKMTTSKSDKKLSELYVKFVNGEYSISTSMKMISKMLMFIQSSENCELLWNPKKENSALYLKADNRFMLAMPHRETSDSELFAKVVDDRILTADDIQKEIEIA